MSFDLLAANAAPAPSLTQATVATFLLGIITLLLGIVAWFLQREIKSNDEAHKQLKAGIDGTRRELKSDVDGTRRELKAGIDETRHELKAEIDETRRELNAEIDETRRELKADINELKADVKTLETNVQQLLVGQSRIEGLLQVRHQALADGPPAVEGRSDP